MLKKIFLVIDVDNDTQRDRIQNIANEASSKFRFKGTQVEHFYSFYRQYENEISQLFRNVSQNGFNTQTMMSIGKLASKMIRKK